MSSYIYLSHDFTLSPVPLGLGGLAMYSRYNRDALVGNLCNQLLGVLYRTPFVASSKVGFSLVNVTNLMNRSSAGALPTPPIESHGSKWLFTFSLMSGAEYADGQTPAYVSARQLGVYVWSTQTGRPTFITIGITPFEAEQYELGSDMFLPRFLYYMVGAYTKSAMLNQRWKLEEPTVPDYTDMYKAPLASYRGNLLRPLSACMINKPVTEWVFSRAVWNQTPGLLTPKHIVPVTVAYYLAYLGNVNRLYYGAYRQLYDQMFHQLRLSLISVMSRSTSKQKAADLSDVLYWGLFPETFKTDNPIQDMFDADAQRMPEYNPDFVGSMDDQLRKLFFDAEA